jgi:hypothetical protein
MPLRYKIKEIKIFLVLKRFSQFNFANLENPLIF